MDIPLYQNFRNTWKSVDSNDIQCYKDTMHLHLTVSERENIIKFYQFELLKDIVCDDYREPIELSVIFLGGDKNLKFDHASSQGLN